MSSHALLRTRWAAIGAAVAVTLGAGGLGIAQATTSSGPRAIFTPITPCRLIDTRPAPNTVGTRTSPLGPAEQLTLQGRGNVGKCTGLPGDSSALSLNVTAVNATAPTFLTLFPANAARPTSSNLNPAPGSPPTPNAMTVGLSSNGRFNVYSQAGSVHLIIDVVGVYQDHNHDDRYYTKSQTVARVLAASEVIATPGKSLPALADEAAFTATLSETVTSTVTGRWLVSKTVRAYLVCPSGSAFFFLVVDGAPLLSSAILTATSAYDSYTLVGAATDAIPARCAHRLRRGRLPDRHQHREQRLLRDSGDRDRPGAAAPLGGPHRHGVPARGGTTLGGRMSTSTTPSDRIPELPKAYVPADAEPTVRARWAASDVFHAVPVADGAPTYSIVIPPPNVTAALHLGHALNNTLQDVMIRYHRMGGFETLWMPGTDHAGIATQTVVEKRLLADGVRRLDMGRHAFVARTQEWKDEYEQVILDQLKAMGASCDFARTRFTMDEMCATAVQHAFYVLFGDGLVYRGKRLVNWDPVTRTALSDDEVEMEEVAGHMWYLRYPLADPLPDGTAHVTVATTRPETMLGDTAVAINPDDPRAEALLGRSVMLPIVGREIPIVVDDYVVMADPDSSDAKAQHASGFLKVTPAHDPNDWEIGVRHGLPVVNVLGPDGTISDEYGWDDVSDEASRFVGMSREDARTAVVEWFREHGLLEDVRDYTHSVGHSYRSHVPIEPWLSDQWYVAVTDDRLRGAALRALHPDQVHDLPAGVAPRSPRRGDGELRIIPERYTRSYVAWHENIRDWCVSRQLWWGHQIPVWLRTIALAAAEPDVVAALDGRAVDEPVLMDSRWTAAGAKHLVRKVTEHEVEEAVCVPPGSTLRRLDTDAALAESELVGELERTGYERDPDVLDTWFSSALWPMSTMGWPWPEDHPETIGLLDSFNPTSLLSTARDIITLWVSRMVMFNRYFLDGQLPFRDVFIHSVIQDGHGQTMSKSLGNGLDPRDVIHSHGADAMRFALVQMTTDTQDVRMPVDIIDPHSGRAFEPEFTTTAAGKVVPSPIQTSPTDPSKQMVSAYGVASGLAAATDDVPLARNTSSKFDLGRNFANKLWNATRFALHRIEAATPAPGPVDLAQRPIADRWILGRLAQTVARLEAALAVYQFNAYADTLYDFVWRDVCDRYLEAIKPTIDSDPEQQVVLGAVLDAVLRIMHPVCPFVTEALWPNVSAARRGEVAGAALPPSELLAGAAWPVIADDLVDAATITAFERADDLVSRIRALRGSKNVLPKQRITLHAPAAVLELIASVDGVVEVLAGIGAVHDIAGDRPAVASPITFEGAELLLSGLVDEIDLDAERARLAKVLDGKTKQIAGFRGRLANEGFLANAKPEMVADTRAMLAAAEAELAAAQAALANLG